MTGKRCRVFHMIRGIKMNFIFKSQQTTKMKRTNRKIQKKQFYCLHFLVIRQDQRISFLINDECVCVCGRK